MKPIEVVAFYVRRKAAYRETGKTSLTSRGPFVNYGDAELVWRQHEAAPREPGYEYAYSIEAVPTAVTPK